MKSVEQECAAKSVKQECEERSVKKECQARVSSEDCPVKSVLSRLSSQECQECLARV